MFPPVNAAARPRLLRVTTILLTISALSPIVNIIRPSPGPAWLGAVATVIMALGLVVISYFWRGYNWARIVELLVSGLAVSVFITSPAFPVEKNNYQIGQTWFDTALAVWLLYWLNTAPVKAWFKPRRITAPPTDADSPPPIPEPR